MGVDGPSGPSPKVSVVIATYNRGSRIATTLDSVLNQTRPAQEILVVDDGSTDDTAAWVREHYPQVRVLTFPNGRTSLARNRGAAAAAGAVLVFLDHDDRMQPHAIATLLGLLETFPEARAAHADHTLRDVISGEYWANHHSVMPAFQRLRRIPPMRSHGSARVYGTALYRALLHGNLLQQPWAVHKAAFTELRGFDPDIRYCEDWDMYIRVSSSFPVAVSDDVISDHLIEGGNLHRVSGQEEQHMKVLRKLLRNTPIWRLGVVRVLRMRLGMYHKVAGDVAWEEGRQDAALSQYRSSFAYWPMDYVVVARCTVWSVARALRVGAWTGARR